MPARKNYERRKAVASAQEANRGPTLILNNQGATLDLSDSPRRERPSEAYVVRRHLLAVSERIPDDHPLHALAAQANDPESDYRAGVAIVSPYLGIRVVQESPLSVEKVGEIFEAEAEKLPKTLDLTLRALLPFGSKRYQPGMKYAGYDFTNSGRNALFAEQGVLLNPFGFFPSSTHRAHLNVVQSFNPNFIDHEIERLSAYKLMGEVVTLGEAEVVSIKIQDRSIPHAT